MKHWKFNIDTNIKGFHIEDEIYRDIKGTMHYMYKLVHKATGSVIMIDAEDFENYVKILKLLGGNK